MNIRRESAWRIGSGVQEKAGLAVLLVSFTSLFKTRDGSSTDQEKGMFQYDEKVARTGLLIYSFSCRHARTHLRVRHSCVDKYVPPTVSRVQPEHNIHGVSDSHPLTMEATPAAAAGQSRPTERGAWKRKRALPHPHSPLVLAAAYATLLLHPRHRGEPFETRPTEDSKQTSIPPLVLVSLEANPHMQG